MERNARLELVALLYVRGGTTETPPTKAAALKALLPLLRHLGDAEAQGRIEAAFDDCLAAGELEERKPSGRQKNPQLNLSRSGEGRLEKEFGKLPNASWAKLRDEYLIPSAAAGSSRAPAGLKSYPVLRAYLALRANGIDYRPNLSDAAVLNRIVARQLNAPRADKSAIKTSMIRSWLRTDLTPADASPEQASARAGAPPEFDLVAFARQVNEAARESLGGRWGTEKIFVNHVWRQFQSLGHGAGLDAADFKKRLLEANQRGLVRLSRADLVSSMPPDDVRESEIATFGNDVLHFINI
jgi:hypothetical protein